MRNGRPAKNSTFVNLLVLTCRYFRIYVVRYALPCMIFLSYIKVTKIDIYISNESWLMRGRGLDRGMNPINSLWLMEEESLKDKVASFYHCYITKPYSFIRAWIAVAYLLVVNASLPTLLCRWRTRVALRQGYYRYHRHTPSTLSEGHPFGDFVGSWGQVCAPYGCHGSGQSNSNIKVVGHLRPTVGLQIFTLFLT